VSLRVSREGDRVVGEVVARSEQLTDGGRMTWAT